MARQKTFPPAIIGVKPSKILPGEVGLFALRPLKKGTIINNSAYCGERFFSRSVYDRLDKITKKVVDDFAEVMVNGFYSVPDVNYMPISWFCNHNCEPNTGIDKDGNILLIRNVREGEELTLDYGFFSTNPEWKMDCKCGSKNCRKSITGHDWKIKQLQEKYNGWFSWYLQEKINMLKNNDGSRND